MVDLEFDCFFKSEQYMDFLQSVSYLRIKCNLGFNSIKPIVNCYEPVRSIDSGTMPKIKVVRASLEMYFHLYSIQNVG